jgi:hypothetical protein
MIPTAELAHPRRAEHQPAAGQEHQLSVRRRMPPSPPSADRLRCEDLLAGERVHQRRFADAGGAEQGDRVPGSKVRADELEPVTGQARDRMHGDAKRNRLDLEHAQLEVGVEVGLRQDDDGLRAALPGHRDVALEPAQIEVFVQ